MVNWLSCKCNRLSSFTPVPLESLSPWAGQMAALDLGEQQHAKRHQRMRPVVTGEVVSQVGLL